jgi:large subunit ribosomal protein L10
MLRSEKTAAIDVLKDRFSRMTSAVFLDFQGMTVEEISRLRDAFRSKGVEYKVIKNTLVRQALSGAKYLDALTPALRGMTGVAWSYEEPSAAAKAVKDFKKDNEKLRIKAGLLEGQVLNAEQVENQLAALPGRDELRAMLLATLMAPAQRFVMLLNAPAQNMVGVLAAKQRKDEGG